ncbi:DUF6049 family protein [Demequina maris]|uniref:DUF6049 family protein n=1 Tax=Demequina maris TaxID=1638982 RepID=UPI0012DFEE88|nr:DUF6049 family protein [Demequina maris]
MSGGTMRGSRRHVALRRALAGTAVLVATAALAPAAAIDVVPTGASTLAVGTIESAPTPMLRPGQSMTTVVTVENDEMVPLDDARVLLRVTREPLEDRESLVAYLDGEDASMVTVGSADVGTSTVTSTDGGQPTPVTRLGSGASTTVSVTSQDKRLPFIEDTWAVHGVEVLLRTDTGDSTILTGAVTYVDAPMPELQLSTVATASGLSARVRSIAAATDIDGVTLAIDESALAGLGTGTLDLSDRDVMRLPTEDPDLVSLAHADNSALLEFALRTSLTTGVSTADDTPWLAVVDRADRSTARLVAREGAEAILMTSTRGASAAEVTPAVSVTRAGGEDIPLLTPDATLSSYLGAGATTDAGGVGATIAVGALTAAESASPVLAWTGDEWSPTGTSEASVLSALMNAPFVDAVDLAELVAEPAGTTVDLRWKVGAADDLDAATIAGLSNQLADLTDLSTVADDPDAFLGEHGTALLPPVARSVREDAQTRQLRVVQATADADETLEALHVAIGSDVNFIADKGSLPVTVVNGLDVDATVVVDMTSFSPNLQIRETPRVTIPANSSKTVPVEVEAVSSADVSAITVLRNTDGISIATPVSMSVRVRADWGTAVTAVFTAGLVVLLVMGVIRTVRRGRKETRTTRVSDKPDPEE